MHPIKIHAYFISIVSLAFYNDKQKSRFLFFVTKKNVFQIFFISIHFFVKQTRTKKNQIFFSTQHKNVKAFGKSVIAEIFKERHTMSFYYHLKLKDFFTAVDLQLLLYILAVAESLLYGLIIITYIGALIAFRKAEENYNDEDSETSKLLEVEAMIQIFGIAMFFIVSVVMVGGVKEVS